MVYDDYLWLVVVGSIAAFWCGWGNGANDVANAFATSVGSKTLTLRQAVLISLVFDFLGALVLGRVTQSVVQGDIANPDVFKREPEIYAYGMMIVMFMSAVWQGIGCYYGWNVSGGHSLIGGIIGFSLVYGGNSAVNWATPKPANFPPYTGIVPIVVTWICAPVLGAIASGIMFWILRFLVLRRSNAYDLAFWVLPPFVFLTAWIDIFFIFTKGAKKSFSPDDNWSDEKAGWIAVCCAAGLTLVSAVVVLPILRYRAKKYFEELAETHEQIGTKIAVEKDEEKVPEPIEEIEQTDFKARAFRFYKKAMRIATWGMDQDVFDAVRTDERVKELHETAEVFDPKCEYVFAYLQVFSAICVIVAHGAGEVGYSSGPLGVIISVYETGALPSKNSAPIWAVLIGAFGIVIGNATYGANVIRSMGTKMSKITPSRGFCAELMSAMISMIGTQYGLPMSGSMIIVGCIVGVGLVENPKKGVNWRVFAEQIFAWISTLFFMGIVCAAIFSWGVYAPGRAQGRQVIYYENALNTRVSNILKEFNNTLKATSGFNYGTYTNTLMKRVNYTYNNVRKVTGTSVQTVEAEDVIAYLDAALTLMQTHLDYKNPNTEICSGADTAAGSSCTSAPATTPAAKLTSTSQSLSTKNI